MREFNEMEHYGDMISNVWDGSFRCMSANLNNIPVSPDDPKNQTLCDSLEQLQVDIFLGQEIGLNERVFPEQHRFRARLEKQFGKEEMKLRYAYNRHNNVRGRQLYGGTCTLTTFKLAAYANGSGEDESGLGRWAWSRIRGRHGTMARFVSVYRPCENKRGA